MNKLSKLYRRSSWYPVYNSDSISGKARTSLLGVVIVQAIVGGFTGGIFLQRPFGRLRNQHCKHLHSYCHSNNLQLFRYFLPSNSQSFQAPTDNFIHHPNSLLHCKYSGHYSAPAIYSVQHRTDRRSDCHFLYLKHYQLAVFPRLFSLAHGPYH